MMKIGYCTIMWDGASKMSHEQPHWSLVFIEEAYVVYNVGFEGSPLLWPLSGKPKN